MAVCKRFAGPAKKLVMLSRTRDMRGLFFLCADDYDFSGFLRELKVPEVRAVCIRACAPDRLTPAGTRRVAQDLAAKWARYRYSCSSTQALYLSGDYLLACSTPHVSCQPPVLLGSRRLCPSAYHNAARTQPQAPVEVGNVTQQPFRC
jgi:hypothetical protein